MAKPRTEIALGSPRSDGYLDSLGGQIVFIHWRQDDDLLIRLHESPVENIHGASNQLLRKSIESFLGNPDRNQVFDGRVG